MSSLKAIADSGTRFISDMAHTGLSLLKMLILWRKPARYPLPAHATCVVLGNGPSLAEDLKQYRTELQRHALLCVNGFSISEAYTELKPMYYLMLDPAFWEADTPAIQRILDAIVQRTDWSMHLYVPHAARKFSNLRKIGVNKNIHLHYFNYIVYDGFQSLGNRLFRLGWVAPQCQNVLVAAVYHAINAGHRQVIILGADHSWHENIIVKEDNVVYTKEIHFYDNVEHCTYVPFHTEIGAKTTRTMGELFYTWSKVYNGYYRIKKYADFMGCTIYNAGRKSFIDAFQRISQDDNAWK